MGIMWEKLMYQIRKRVNTIAILKYMYDYDDISKTDKCYVTPKILSHKDDDFSPLLPLS